MFLFKFLKFLINLLNLFFSISGLWEFFMDLRLFVWSLKVFDLFWVLLIIVIIKRIRTLFCPIKWFFLLLLILIIDRRTLFRSILIILSILLFIVFWLFLLLVIQSRIIRLLLFLLSFQLLFLDKLFIIKFFLI